MHHLRIMVSGGGTGGHITPALALCATIKNTHPRAVLYYIGRRLSMEERMARQLGVRFISMHSAPLKKGVLSKLSFALNMSLGVIEALGRICRHSPHLIVGFGGYASFPLLLAGVIMRKPVTVHESNAVPGKAVRLLVRLGARFAYSLDTGHPRLARLINRARDSHGVCKTGTPLRRSFLQATRAEGLEMTGLRHDALTVMVLGGSQGARRLNTIATESLGPVSRSVPRLQVVHLTGINDTDTVKEKYESLGIPHYVAPFCDRIGALYRLADVALSRAGALTIAELAAAGVPAILVPFPYATDNHQFENAKWLAREGGAIVMMESELTTQALANVLTQLLQDNDKRRRMALANRSLARPNAAEALWDFVEQCLNANQPQPNRGDGQRSRA